VPDAADDDLVVPARQGVLHGAFDDGDDAVQPRAAGRPAAVPYPVPRRGEAAPGEVGRQVGAAGGRAR
jgi:hypothetical protein